VGLLQWFVLGCLGRVISWPLGFVMLALGKTSLFFATETIANVVHLALIWTGLRVASLDGVAIAFFVLYVFYTAVVYFLCKRLIGFCWTRSTLRLFSILLTIVAAGFLAARTLPKWPATAFGLITFVGSSLFCLRALINLIGKEHKIVSRARLIPGVGWICGL
jgi:PST family polysaccharide transporter